MDFNLGKMIRSSYSPSFSSPNPDLSSPIHLFSASFSLVGNYTDSKHCNPAIPSLIVCYDQQDPAKTVGSQSFPLNIRGALIASLCPHGDTARAFTLLSWATWTLFLLPQDKESMLQERECVCDSG